MDVERTIEFLLEQTARNQAGIEALTDRVTGMMNVVDRIVTIQERLAEAQVRTEARLDRLTERIDRLTERVDTLAEATRAFEERTEYAIRALMDTVNRLLPPPTVQ